MTKDRIPGLDRVKKILLLLNRPLYHSAFFRQWENHKYSAIWVLFLLLFTTGTLFGLFFFQKWLYWSPSSIFFERPHNFTICIFVAFPLALFFYLVTLSTKDEAFSASVLPFVVVLFILVPFAMDTYILVKKDGVRLSLPESVGDSIKYSWDEVERVSLDYGNDGDGGFEGDYILYFKDGNFLDLWWNGRGSVEDIKKFHEFFKSKNIPIKANRPLNQYAVEKLMSYWDQNEIEYVKQLFSAHLKKQDNGISE
ncbi:hypothetical protein ACFO25_07650 [Paenactinomyces guangxiensis]|uniref:Uncharacterized protein n=1 Tax=Paenactinomyces guangxiensis TaxID=1490290 RepID=A0A7W1WNH3_9BACL|nr:hypothetical protein [Paenactinomyces guangxiensis]MBA4493080.1 hypothetical protein [Paenactinomyces guangxiensis]MBH8590070.1 hypothetical protein [Paenactinomyces guangxiensis]